MSIVKTLPEYVQDNIKLQAEGLRDDLLAIPDAEDNGWVISFKKDDWHNPASFTKGVVNIWETVNGWKAADLIDDFYKNHRPYDSLKDALEKEG